MIVFLTAFLLMAYDGPRLVPAIPKIPTPWQETGNRRARRREAAEAR